MHLSTYWAACLSILEGLIPARGQCGFSDCFMPPFVCTAIPENKFTWTYPEWQIVGSYQDVIDAYNRAMAILENMKGGRYSTSAESYQPNVTTWKDWVELNNLKHSVNLEEISSEIQADAREILVSIIVASRDDFKHFFNTVRDRRLPDSIILVVRKSDSEFQKEPDNLDVRFFEGSLREDTPGSLDEILNENFSEIENGSDEEPISEATFNEIKLPAQEMNGDSDTNEGLDIKVADGINSLESKHDSEVRKRQSARRGSTFKASGQILDNFNVHSRQNYDVGNSDEIIQQKNNEGGSQDGRFSFLRQSARLDGQESDSGQNGGFPRKMSEAGGKHSEGNTIYSEWNSIPRMFHTDRKGSLESVKSKFSHEKELKTRAIQDDPQETFLTGGSAESDFSWSNSLEGQLLSDDDEESDSTNPAGKSLPLLGSTDDKDAYFELNCKRFLDRLQVDEKKQKEIEESTKEQANCERWHQERKYRLTASCFGIVWNWTDSKQRLIYRLLYSFPRNSTDKQSALDWGRDNERKAALTYGRANNVSISPSGLIVDLKRGYLAASPDGLIGNDTVCEIKCPYFLRNSVPLALVKTDELYCCTYDFEKGQVRLKRHHYYYYQIQGQMAISGRKKGVFILWSPRGFVSETIDYNPELWERMVVVLESFYKKYLVPEYLYNYHRYERHYDDKS